MVMLDEVLMIIAADFQISEATNTEYTGGHMPPAGIGMFRYPAGIGLMSIQKMRYKIPRTSTISPLKMDSSLESPRF